MMKDIRADARSFAEQVLAETRKEMYGLEEVTKLCLVALVTEGHVLLEGNPGLGKTMLAKTLHKVLRLPWGRIQFTPDLMPADITGTFMPPLPKKGNSGEPGGSQGAQTHEAAVSDRLPGVNLEFRPGPLFTSFLLADEINRATPKTQAAMLEAMAERQVTVLGHRYRLDSLDFITEDMTGSEVETAAPQEERPFMVMATQNPLDYEGTWELPKAQSDRFMFKLLVPLPNTDDLTRILRKDAGLLNESSKQDPAQPLKESPNAVVEFLIRLRGHVLNSVGADPVLVQHAVNMFMASNKKWDQVHIDPKADGELRELSNRFQFGLSPRAIRDLVKAAKAWVLLFKGPVARPDAAALASVVLPTLRHRLLLGEGSGAKWWEEYRKKHPESAEGRAADYFLLQFCLACLPPKKGVKEDYGHIFEVTLANVVRERLC